MQKSYEQLKFQILKFNEYIFAINQKSEFYAALLKTIILKYLKHYL